MSTLETAWFIARKDVKYMLRQRETLLWVFIMPVVFFFFIGTITSGFGEDRGGTRGTPLAVSAPEDAGHLVDHLIRHLENQKFSVERMTPAALDSLSEPPRRLVSVESDFTDAVLAAERTGVDLRLDADAMDTEDAEYDRVRVSRAVYSVLADVVLCKVRERDPGDAELQLLIDEPRHIQLEVRAAGERRHIPSGFEQAIPGTLTMFTLLVLFTSGSVLMVIERREGLLRRLACAPLDRGAIVLGKWAGRMALAVVQVGFAMLAGALFFKMQWGPQLPALIAVLAVYGSLAASLGMLLGNLVRNESQAVGIGVLASNILAPLGGCWWPIEITPRWMQDLALAVPTGWAMDAMHKLVSFGMGPSSIVPHILVLGSAALVCGWIVARTFRFQ